MFSGMTRNSGMSSFKIRFKANVNGKPCYEVLRCCGNFRLLEKGMKEMKVFYVWIIRNNENIH